MKVHPHWTATKPPSVSEMPETVHHAGSANKAQQRADAPSVERPVRTWLSRDAALNQLRPREAQRCPGSPAPSQPRKKQTLKAQTKNIASARQFSVNTIIPGTGRAVNRPLRAEPPIEKPFKRDSHPEPVLLGEAKQLSSIAKSLASSIGRPEAPLWKRPAPSAAYRGMTKLFPWTKPAPLVEVSTIHGHRRNAARAHDAYGAPVAGRSQIAESARQLLGQLDTKRQVLDESAANFERARSAHDDSRRTSPTSAQTSMTAERRLQAKTELRAARDALHAAMSGSDLAGLEGLHYLAYEHEKGYAFMRAQINELQAKAHALRTDAYDRRDAIDQEIRAQTEKARVLMSLDQTHVEAEFERRNDRIAELMKQRPVADAQRDEAERSLAWLAHAASRLGKRAPAAPVSGGVSGADIDGKVETQAINTLHERFVAQQADMPRAFGPHTSARLQAALRALAVRLRETGASAKLPVTMAMEVVTTALADSTRGDAELAVRILDALAGQTVEHWAEQAQADMRRMRSPQTGDAPSQRTASIDRDLSGVLAFNRAIAALPRGSELLHALSRDGKSPTVKEQMQALHVFWTADDAIRRESDSSVKAWLGAAQRVALSRLVRNQDGASEADSRFDDVDHAAYHAVRNGYLSNAAGSLYDQHNARMKKAIGEWTIRAAFRSGGASDAPRPISWRRIVPTLNKTPFSKRLLNRGYDVAESMGLDSARRRVDRAVRQYMAAVEPLLELSARHGGGEGALDALFAKALLDYLKQLDRRGRHLSKHQLTDRDTTKMIERLPKGTQKLHAEHFKALIKEIAPYGSVSWEALSRLDARLRSRIPVDLQPPEQEFAAGDDLTAAVHLLKTQRLGDKRDIVTFFKPFILDMALRDKVRLGGGGTLGIGLPTLPYGPQTPAISPLVFAETSRSDEAFVQLFMPVLGIEMMFGKTRTHAQEATIGAIAGHAFGPHASLQGSATLHAGNQRAKTSATLMRFFRKRHDDVATREKMLNALDSLVRWDMISPTSGRAYSGPLEAVFARNPEVSVSQVDAVANTRTISAALSARLPAIQFSDLTGAAQSTRNETRNFAQTGRVEASVSVEAQRSRERRDERGGHVNVYAATGDSAQQRVSVATGVAATPLSYLPPGGKPHAHVGAQRESIGLQLGITSDIAWAMEKHEISPFLLDGKQDADLDRHYSTPADMLKEISANREHWLMRCVETLPPDEHGNTDTPANRMRAATLLEEFEHEIRWLGKSGNYYLYNVNYSMRGAASEWIDGYRALAALASKRGDIDAQRKAEEKIDEILVMRGTWRPLMLIVRERAKDSKSTGWRNLLRWQRTATVDGQRTAAQFPPP